MRKTCFESHKFCAARKTKNLYFLFGFEGRKIMTHVFVCFVSICSHVRIISYLHIHVFLSDCQHFIHLHKVSNTKEGSHIKKFSTFCKTQRFNTVFTGAWHCTLSGTRSVHCITLHYITLHFVDPLVSPDTGYETCQKE